MFNNIILSSLLFLGLCFMPLSKAQSIEYTKEDLEEIKESVNKECQQRRINKTTQWGVDPVTSSKINNEELALRVK